MFRQKPIFHLSQVTVPRNTIHVPHHRPLALFLLFVILCQQLGILWTSANSYNPTTGVPKYVYIQTNPVIDDSWMGTRTTKEIINTEAQPSIYSVSYAGKYQRSDSTWILPQKWAQKKQTTKEKNLVFNAAPTIPVENITTNNNSYNPVSYVTPNGTPLSMIGGYTSSSSNSALVNNSIVSGNQSVSGDSVILGNQSISGSLFVTGSTTLSDLIVHDIHSENLILNSGTGIPVEILWRNASGKVNNINIGSGIILSGGELSLFADTDIITEWIINLYYTDARAQNALSGTISQVYSSLSGLTLDISSFSGLLSNTNSRLTTLSGNLSDMNSLVLLIWSDVNLLSGSIAANASSIAMNSINITSLSGSITILSGLAHNPLTLGADNGLSLLWQQLSLNIASSTTTGALSLSDWNTFNNKINFNSLSAGSGITYNNTTGIFGWNGTTSDVIEWSNLYYTTIRANTDFDNRLVSKSTTDLSEGTNLYYTVTRARSVLSASGGVLTYDNINWIIDIKQANSTTNWYLSSIDWNTFNSKENILTFWTGITRVGNTVWIWILTGGMLSGFSTGQLIFGSSNNGLTQSSNLYWDGTNNRLWIGTNSPTQNLTVSWWLYSNKYLLWLDLSLLPIANSQSAVTSWWWLQLIGNKQSTVDYIPTTYGLRDDYGILIPNQQAAKVALMIRGASGQSGNLIQWETSTGKILGAFTANGNLSIWTGNTDARLHIFDNAVSSGILMKIDSSSIQTGALLQITGSGSRNLVRVSQNGTDPLDIERVTIWQWWISATKPDAIGTRDQLYVFGRINSSWDMAWYDFLWGNVANITVDTNLWNGIAYDPIAGATYTITSSVWLSGLGQIALAAATSNGWFFGSAGWTPTERTLNPVFESRVALSQTTNVRAVVWFADRALNAGITADANNFANEAFFRKVAAGTVWTAVTRNASGTETITPLTQNPSTMSIMRIEIDNTGSGAVRFYINGALVATHTTNIPAATTRLGYHVGGTLSAATATNIWVDYIRVWSDDPPLSNSPIESFIATSPIILSWTIAHTYSSKWFLQEVDTLLDTATGRTLSGTISFTEKWEYTDGEYAEYVLNFTKKSLEKMSGTRLFTDLWFRSIDTEKISTEKLCISSICYTSGSLVTQDWLHSIIESINNPSVNNYTTVIQSIDSENILSSFSRILEKLFVKIETVFDGIVVFVKTVTFQSSVLFEDRVIFEDRDMAGTAIIWANQNSVRINFDHPYTIVPIVTVSADNFVTYKITHKSISWFTIEVQGNIISDTRFDWIALAATNAQVTISQEWSTQSQEILPEWMSSGNVQQIDQTWTIYVETWDSPISGNIESGFVNDDSGSSLYQTWVTWDSSLQISTVESSLTWETVSGE